MHEAYEVSHLLTATVQIEALAAYESNLLLGTRQGHLLMYSLSASAGGQRYEVQLLRYCKSFSKRPIQQIEVIPEDNLLLCLTDNVLSLHDINGLNFPLVKTLQQTKGATLFALEKMSATSMTGEVAHTSRLCVGIRRKLQVYLGKNGEFKQHLFDISLPDVPRAISWGREHICVGFKSEYTLYHSATSMTGEVAHTSRLCVGIRCKLQVYLGKNGEFKQHLFDISLPDVPRAISWGREHICVGFKSEYTLYHLTDGKPKELFPSSSARPLEPTIAKYSDTGFLLGRDHTSVLVDEATDIELNTIKWSEPPAAAVWDEPYVLGLLQDQIVVQTMEPPLFIQSLTDLNKARLMYRCKRGLIFVASMGQVWCATAVDVTRQRQTLLKDKHFQLAIKLTNLSDDTEETKKQKIHSIQMLYALDLFDNKRYSESMAEFVKLETDPAEVIRLFPELGGTPGDSKAKELEGKDLESALSALIEYLTEMRQRLQAPPPTQKAPPQTQNAPPPTQKVDPADAERESARLRNLSALLELIDTTLLKCYLQTNDALVASLLRLNHCKLDEAERTLLQHGKHSELIILYQTSAQHTKALQLLQEQAHEPHSSLRGYHRTKAYLQNLGSEHTHLIFQFSGWLLREHPEEGLKVFTDDIAEVEQLPRHKVLDFLLREHEPLVIPYLEHVIHAWGDTNPLFHNGLIRMYREKITDKKSTVTEEEVRHTRAKLLAFLSESAHYTPESVLLHFPADALYEERAVVLGRLGQHERALPIYVQILGDVDRAIRYCEAVTARDPDKSQDVYVTLMRILMNPAQGGPSGPLAGAPRDPRTSAPDLETALHILEKHPEHISPLKALAVLPDSVPLSRIKGFLQGALESQLSMKRRAQVMKGLLYAEHLQVQELKMYHESQSVVIDQCKLCLTCRKPFGNQSAFVRYPSGDIVHYSCRRDK